MKTAVSIGDASDIFDGIYPPYNTLRTHSFRFHWFRAVRYTTLPFISNSSET